MLMLIDHLTVDSLNLSILIFLTKMLIHCTAAVLSSTLLIGYYHGLLLKYIDPNLLVNKMCLYGLLTGSEEELISTGHSIHHRNQLLLEYVRHMQTVTLMIFCEYVQEIVPRVGSQMVKGMYKRFIKICYSNWLPKVPHCFCNLSNMLHNTCNTFDVKLWI